MLFISGMFLLRFDFYYLESKSFRAQKSNPSRNIPEIKRMRHIYNKSQIPAETFVKKDDTKVHIANIFTSTSSEQFCKVL
jgi:hypothetical protein